ncbi:MAG: DUF4910 domain-containing protein [Cyclobacteriaceae bacterium]
MSLSYQIIKDLYLTNRNFCSDDYDYSIDYISRLLPGKVHFYNEENEYNGWKIPPKWNLKKADIIKNGEIILDGTKHPLQVIGLSKSFSGEITGEELKSHLHYKTHFDVDKNAIPYHFRQNYQPWKRDWGFCVTKEFYSSIDEGPYQVNIETEESKGYLNIFEYTHQGELDKCFYFIAHLDHPGMANDDLSGVAVAIEFFEKLIKRRTKFTYKLLIVPEIIGSGYFLGSLPKDQLKLIRGGLFLEMLGSRTPLSLQFSSKKQSVIDKLLERILADKQDHRVGNFGTIIGNDEIVFESYQIPTPSLSRFPFPEYHTSGDDLSIISEDSLTESIQLLEDLLEGIEQTKFIEKKFDGIICLSNPEYDLYVDQGQRMEIKTNELKELRRLMDFIPLMDREYTIEEIKEQFNISHDTITNYLDKWKNSGLILLE